MFNDNSAKHAERFAELSLAFALDDRLDELDPQLHPSWERGTQRLDHESREAIYRCSAWIEFMQTEFSDLSLESQREREHPHNVGWLRIFDHRVQQPIFQETWRRTQDMYSERFRRFYENRVAHNGARKSAKSSGSLKTADKSSVRATYRPCG